MSLFAGFSKDEYAEMDVNAIHYRELTVTGAFGQSRRDYDRAFDLIASRQLNLKPLITYRFHLDDVLDAFATVEGHEATKVAILNE